MKLLPNKVYRQALLSFVLLSLLAVLLEIRPGNLYFLLQMLLFQDSLLSLLSYVALFGACVWSCHILLLNNSFPIRRAYLILLVPSLIISYTFRLLTGYNYSYTDAQNILNNLHFMDAAVSNYNLVILAATAGALLTALLLFLVSRRSPKIYKPAQALFCLPVVLFCYLYLQQTLGQKDLFPAFFRVPMVTLLASQHQLPLGKREPVKVNPTTKGAKHIFMVVDESITGNALSLNGNTANTTPYLLAAKDSILNFGVASSITNYSAGSNIALISGLQNTLLPDLKHFALTKPTILQYAKKAGYTTYYIDAQTGLGVLQNYISASDLAYVDHFIQPADSTQLYHERDYVVARVLRNLSKSTEKVFVWVTKVGAHWPYARTYPPDSVHFSPVLGRTSMLKDRERSVNTYYNSIRWTVDGFWKELITGIAATDSTVVIYTSDHGQNLAGDGIQLAHASVHEVPPIEANVPLWLLDKSGYTLNYKRPAPNQQAHEQIFPTLLLLQGYDQEFIRKAYGRTLFDAPASPRFFLSGDIFGRGPNQRIRFKIQNP